MNWKYRPDFQAFPGVKLSYGRQGIKTDIVPTVNTDNEDAAVSKEKLMNRLYKPYDPQHEIKSGATHSLTSDHLKEFKSLLLNASDVREETAALLKEKEQQYGAVTGKLNRLRKSLFKSFYKKKIARFEEESGTLNEQKEELTEQLRLSVINLEIDTEDIYFELYHNIKDAFQLLKRSKKKWDFTSSRATNRVAERTSAANTITRSEIELTERKLPILNTDAAAFCIHNINGGDIYFFPAFMIVYESKENFALIDYTDAAIEFSVTRFIEDEQVPDDSEIVGRTWFKVNKDGSPDRRFANNYQIPIVEYGQLRIQSATGVNELYCFSNKEYTSLFYKSVYDYMDSLKTAKKLLENF
ncbi:hypothetical protein [Niabella drilacis]|uniref:Uncharacterized protein n=1 Tax=Niabella drilacis (strain DSM 25811 / CCM 8410 / CCUG 62505 / LMG 26954 / E90) TaxID=1285928 RepID=A0A1G6W006_NIADE|nr:hypothetical protein [Niabella drilacis]SDD58406.1 hypothetical protein SAMN04487894_110193 [Niabella drilacis]